MAVFRRKTAHLIIGASMKSKSEKVVREIKRRTRKKYSAEEKIRIVLEGLRGEDSIAALCRREGIQANMSWKLFPTMSAGDVMGVLDMALDNTGVDKVNVSHRPRLLSDNGPCYLSSELKDYLDDRGMDHTRGAPYHPQTQGKIERYHRTMKNVVKLQNYYVLSELEVEIGKFVDYYNNERYHESLDNVTPADMYHGRRITILNERDIIKQETMRKRRILNQKHGSITMQTTT